MPGRVDARGSSYISSHSADVIMSDIRPTKLKPDALRAINALLDEFLYNILSISGSLATDKLRASLLSLLPTNLGKEALLEAEVELRAYWERTDARAPVDDDTLTFHLQWAFELLRLKCEAYSTLNEEDEDPYLEGRVSEKLGKSYPHPQKVGLVDPAALYLTAILESICEHILSNVGRVVARDSSRTNATINDLFVALCEDDSIYGLFKTMKVYEQIEVMSKGPQPRRSKSFTQNDLVPTPRTSSPYQELNRVTSSSGSHSRQSLDRQSAATIPCSGSVSGASFEKSRAIRMFVNSNSKVSNDRDGDSQFSHTKSESMRSETSRQLFGDDDIPNIAEDAAMLREFDDLMRSTSTMKVSLTPDRLRTMEVYKQEKDQRDINRRPRPPPHFSLSKSDIPPTSQPRTQKPSLHLVDSIIEDEEEIHSSQSRTRQGSIASQSTSSFAAIIPGRIRSVSASSSGTRTTHKKLLRSPSARAAPTPLVNIPVKEMVQSREVRKPFDNSFPARTRNRQHRHDSLDLDDVMNGSDVDVDQGSILKNQNLSPATQRTSRAQYPVSQHTRELMNFLAEGPPEAKLSQSGSELLDFLAQGPPEYGGSAATLDPSKPKGAGRLQRMISKLSMGGEKGKGSDGSRTPSLKQPSTPVRSTFSSGSTISLKQPTTPVRSSAFVGNVATPLTMANKPVPPRPRPLSPPPSPPHDEDKFIRNPPRSSHQDTPPPREAPIERAAVAKPVPVAPVTLPLNKDTPEKPNHRPASHVNGNARNGHSPKEASPEPQQPISPVRTVSRKAVPTIDLSSTCFFTKTDAQDMQRLFTNATTVDECRLIFDMFMARNGVAKGSAPETDAPYPSPSPSVIKHAPLVHSSVGEALIESTLVEFFLGDTATPDISRLPSEEGQPDALIEALPVAVEAEADVKPAVNTPPSNKPSVPLPIPQCPS